MLINYIRVGRERVDDIGQVGAGSTVEFRPRGKTWITRPRNARATDSLVSAVVSGNSLEEDGIRDGDRLTCRTNFDLSEIRNGRLVIVKLPCGNLTVKKFYLLEGGVIKLRAGNSSHNDMYYELEDIEVKAIVIESVRSWE